MQPLPFFNQAEIGLVIGPRWIVSRFLAGRDEHGHAAAADQAVVPAVIVVQSESHYFWAAAAMESRQRSLLHLGFNATAAKGSLLAAIGKDEHGCPRLLRRRPAGFDNGAIDAGSPLKKESVHFLKDVAHGQRGSKERAAQLARISFHPIRDQAEHKKKSRPPRAPRPPRTRQCALVLAKNDVWSGDGLWFSSKIGGSTVAGCCLSA